MERDTVARVAHLARIKLSEDEKDTMVQELKAILQWVECLDKVNVNHLQPVIATPSPLRSDKVEGSSGSECLLKNAPETTMSFYTVPKVLGS